VKPGQSKSGACRNPDKAATRKRYSDEMVQIKQGGRVMNNLYEQDFYQWTIEQANLLRTGALSQLDIKNLIEEVESMGKSQKKELLSRLAVLLVHLLKWDHQQKRRGKSWLKTIATQRTEIGILMIDNPSLKSELIASVHQSYQLARRQAATETEFPVSVFPETCPYTIEQIMGE
jgi:hypothetical protein